MFKSVDANAHFPQLEEDVLKYWKDNKIFEKSIESRPVDKVWNFLDGPPFVTGTPHYGSLLSSLPKDVFGRYWTMKGYRVRRVWGWDGHGLPIENKVENELEIKRKKDIEDKVGVEKFIELCKKYVNRVSAEWEWYVDHVGRWVDFGNAYKTWSTDYMESVMWVFKQMYDKDLIYKGLRVSLYCPHCATPISNFEVAMDAENYKDVLTPATIYKYPVEGEKNTYFLAWSTTPWNKIVTPALAVNPKLEYVKVKQGDEVYILAKSTIKTLRSETKPKILETYKGKDLVGKRFVPHYDFYKKDDGKRYFEIVGDEFVTAEEGTGIVTLAVYGEEDLKVMLRDNLPLVFHVDEEGMILPHVPQFGGMYYLKANKLVNEDLKKRGLVYHDEERMHSVAHCWRCATRLFYNPLDAWYVNVQKLKTKMEETNKSVNWYPAHFKEGRFLKSMKNAPDWNISRNRYWGSPVPVWECECGERFVPGSIKELEETSGQKVPDLHKPAIDNVFVTCKKCGKKAKRTSEVLDSWIEAGSASFAERHYPFALVNGKPEDLKDFFPPDFIAEYTGQIRAWFYVLHVIGAAIYESPAFKNVAVTGVILGTDGRKMSKNFKNYPDPKEMLSKYGGDALRLYLMSTPVMRGEDILISEQDYRNQVRGFLLILWNVYKYFVTYAHLADFIPTKDDHADLSDTSEKKDVLDQWMYAYTEQTTKDVTESLEKYDTIAAIQHLYVFVQDVSTWYIRRNRDRSTDRTFLSMLYNVLVTTSKLLAPLAPFISEEIFRNLTEKESVHLENWPTFDQKAINRELIENMKRVRHLSEMGHSKRKEQKVAIKQPLAKVIITLQKDATQLSSSLNHVLMSELNVKDIEYREGEIESIDFDWNLTDALKEEGEARQIIRKIQEERKNVGTTRDERITVHLPSWPAMFEEDIKKATLSDSLVKSDKFSIERR